MRIQLCYAMIAALLLALACGRSITRRQDEMVCLHLTGWADEDDLLNALGVPPP